MFFKLSRLSLALTRIPHRMTWSPFSIQRNASLQIIILVKNLQKKQEKALCFKIYQHQQKHVASFTQVRQH